MLCFYINKERKMEITSNTIALLLLWLLLLLLLLLLSLSLLLQSDSYQSEIKYPNDRPKIPSFPKKLITK